MLVDLSFYHFCSFFYTDVIVHNLVAYCLTLGLPTFSYPAVYQVVKNDIKQFIATQKANNAEYSKFYKYLSTLAVFLCY